MSLNNLQIFFKALENLQTFFAHTNISVKEVAFAKFCQCQTYFELWNDKTLLISMSLNRRNPFLEKKKHLANERNSQEELVAVGSGRIDIIRRGKDTNYVTLPSQRIASLLQTLIVIAPRLPFRSVLTAHASVRKNHCLEVRTTPTLPRARPVEVAAENSSLAFSRKCLFFDCAN